MRTSSGASIERGAHPGDRAPGPRPMQPLPLHRLRGAGFPLGPQAPDSLPLRSYLASILVGGALGGGGPRLGEKLQCRLRDLVGGPCGATDAG